MAIDEYGKSWRYDLERQHDVSNPIIFNTDIDLQRRMFWEAATSTGILVDFYNCTKDESDFNNDPNLEWEKPIVLPVIFDDHPKVKIIRELGWYTEDDERPTLVYLPMYRDWETKELLDLRDNSLMRIYYYGQKQGSDFRVTSKKLDSLYGVYWVCKLAPERLNDFYIIENRGEHFLKRKRREYFKCNDNINNSEPQVFEHDEYIQNIEMNRQSADDYWEQIMYGETENTAVNFYDYNENTDTTLDLREEDTPLDGEDVR